jgi:23S rRNA pseudouridine1911/1915/1917 synthase
MTNFLSGPGKKYGVEHMLASVSGDLEEVLQKQLGLPSSQARFLRQFGSIYVNEKRCLENSPIEIGTYIRVHQQPRRFPVEVFDFQKAKVFENEDLLVINKPSGLPVPATVDNIQENIAALVAQNVGHEVHVTHRLDMGTSGLLILAKHKDAQAFINRKLMEGAIQKYYRALVHGTDLPQGEWTHYMQPSERAPKRVIRTTEPGWPACKLRVLDQTEVFHGHSEVVIELITGRTHQIRAQLSAEGFPIVGDQAYGSPVKLAAHEEISLQAFFLSFPINETETKSLRLPFSAWQHSHNPHRAPFHS